MTIALGKVTITQVNPVGFPAGLPSDISSDPELQTTLKSVFEYGDDFSVDLQYAYIPAEGESSESGESTTEDPVTDIELSELTFSGNPNGVKAELINPKLIRISGKAIDVFLDAFYQFLMPDNTLKVLPANTQEKFLALVRYEPPSITVKSFNYSLNYKLTYIVGQTSSSSTEPSAINTSNTIKQDVYWSFSIAVTELQRLVSKGVI